MATQNPFYVDPGNDFSAGLSGLSNTLANVRQGRIIEAEQQRKLDAENLQKERLQAATTAGMAALKSGNPEEAAKVSIQYPEFAENLRNSFGFNDEAKAAEAGNFAKALLTADPSQREALYKQRIKNLTDQGRDPSHTVQSLQNYLANPNGELQALETTWAGAFPKEYMVIANQHKAEQEERLAKQKSADEERRFQQAEAGRNQRAYARAAATAGGSASDKLTANRKDFQYYQELKQSDPTSAMEFGRQAGFVSKEGKELSPQVQKRLSLAIDDTVAAERNVGKFEQLASDIEASDFTPGVAGTLGEKFKELTGEQDAISNLRREYNAIKGSQVVNNLPPGAASDKDIELAMAGFPTDRANKQQLAGFLRGLAKVQKLNAEFNGFKADHISDNGSERGMLQAWKQREPGAKTSSPASQQGSAPSVTTQAQFDALPSGAVYLEDGVQYRKP